MHSLSFDARNTTFHKTLYAITRQVFDSEQNIFQMEKKSSTEISVFYNLLNPSEIYTFNLRFECG